MKTVKANPEVLKALGVKPFDAADYLDSDEAVAEYLTAALEDSDPDLFLTAIKDVARARGMTQLARDTGLGRESLGGSCCSRPWPPSSPGQQWRGAVLRVPYSTGSHREVSPPEGAL